MRGEQVPVVGFAYAFRHGADLRHDVFRIPVPADQPDQVVEVSVTASDETSVGAAFLGIRCFHFLVEPFVHALVPEVAGRQKHLDALSSRLPDHPVRVSEISFVRRREITRGQERRITRPVVRGIRREFVFDQVDDDGIESLLPAVVEIQLRVGLGQFRNEGPGVSP